MKKLQASYNNDANKIVKQTTKEKTAIKKLNFLIDLGMVTSNTKHVPGKPKTFGIIPLQNLMQNGRMQFARSLLT